MVWNEILMRGRTSGTQIVITMTPLNGLTPVYKFFYEQNSEKVNGRIKKFLFSSTENKHADHTALEGLTEQDRLMRMF
jgi:phage terminase large subunit-like protein